MLKDFLMLKISTFFLFILISLTCLSQELQSGDVLLISFNCYECRVIESETNSPFSHSGVVFRNKDNNLYVAQSLGSVNVVSLDEFLSHRRPFSKVSVYRPIKFYNFTAQEYSDLAKTMSEIFYLDFFGLKFDSKFLWNNVDESGNELLYCSEFVSKFLDQFLDSQTIPYPLSFKKNIEYWSKYFKGTIPEGELGNSPGSFVNDTRFKFLKSF